MLQAVAILEYAVQNDAELFIEPILQLALSLLLQDAEPGGRSTSAGKPSHSAVCRP